MNSHNARKSLPDFTQGPILKALFTLAIPIVFANILQTAYQLVDTFWVGRLGAEAVAAVSLSFPIIFLIISLGGGLSIAGTILVSQYKGRGDLKQVDYVATQTLMMMILVSILGSIIGYVVSGPILKLMGAEPEVLPLATSYLQISFVGMIFMFAYFVFQSLMRGVGDVKTPLYIVLATVLLNLILDPLFILGWGPIPGYGVSGAAMATVGTQGVAAVIGLAILFNGKYGIHVKWKHFRMDFSLFKQMFFLGLPASIGQSTRALALSIMAFLVASFGTLTVAAYGIGIRVFSFIIIPALGLSMATSTLVGQNMGANKVDRAETIGKQGSLVGFILLTLVGLLLFFVATPLTAAFIPGEPEVIASGSLFVKILAFSFGFVGLQQTMNGVFMGSGNTKTSMILSIMALMVFQFPLAYILSKHTDLKEVGIWVAFPISNVLAATISYLYFLTGRWKHTQIIEPAHAKLEREVMHETMVEEGVQ